MCDPVIGGIVIGTTLLQANAAGDAEKAKNASAEYNAQIQDANALVYDEQAKQRKIKGTEESKQVLQKGDILKGEQRAGFAGAGVTVDTGTAGDVVSDTTKFSIEDALTTRYNADIDVWAKQAQAQDARSQARLSRMSKSSGAFMTTLLTSGATNAATGYMAYKA